MGLSLTPLEWYMVCYGLESLTPLEWYMVCYGLESLTPLEWYMVCYGLKSLREFFQKRGYRRFFVKDKLR